MKQTLSIIKAVRPEMLMIGVSSVCVGVALALMESGVIGGGLNLMPLILCFLFAISAQFAANFIFVHYDFNNHYGYADSEDLADHLSHKGDQELYMRARMLGGVSVVFALTIGIVLISYSGIWALLLGATLVILIYLSVQGPMPLLLTPFSPLVYYIVAGPIGVTGTFLMSFHDSSFAVMNWFDMVPVLMMGLAMGFPAATAQIAAEYERYPESLRRHVSSVTTELGRKGARILVLVNGFLMWGIFWLMEENSSYIYSWIDMVMPTVALLGNILVWRRMALYSPSRKGLKPLKVALINVLLLGVGILLVYCFGGMPVSDPIGEI